MIISRIPQKNLDWLIVASLVTIVGVPPKDPPDDDDENEEDEDDDDEDHEEPSVIRKPYEKQCLPVWHRRVPGVTRQLRSHRGAIHFAVRTAR